MEPNPLNAPPLYLKPEDAKEIAELLKEDDKSIIKQPENEKDLLELFKQRQISIGLGSNDSEIVFPKLDHGMTRSITEDNLMTEKQRAKADGIIVPRVNIKRGLKLDSPSPSKSTSKKQKKVGGKRRKRKTKKRRKKKTKKRRKKKTRKKRGGVERWRRETLQPNPETFDDIGYFYDCKPMPHVGSTNKSKYRENMIITGDRDGNQLMLPDKWKIIRMDDSEFYDPQLQLVDMREREGLRGMAAFRRRAQDLCNRGYKPWERNDAKTGSGRKKKTRKKKKTKRR